MGTWERVNPMASRVPMTGGSWEFERAQLTGVWTSVVQSLVLYTLRTANTSVCHLFSALPPTSSLSLISLILSLECFSLQPSPL